LRIAAIEAQPLEVPLSRPYTIAFKSFSAVEMTAVRIVAEGGAVGLGNASPEPAVTGESFADCNAALAQDGLRFLVGADVAQLPALCREIERRFPDAPAACAALDMALHDLWAQELGRPLVDLLGRCHDSLPTSITIGIKSVEETVSEAEEYVGRGFTVLKVKTGRALDEDVERLRRLRERHGQAIVLRVDANQGYGLDELRRFLPVARQLGVELIEQPLPRGASRSLAELAEEDRRLLAADESVQRPADALRLAHPPAPYGIFNIKLMKCGGIRPALRIAAIAETAGLELMWGCMDESVVSISAALHTALASPATRYLDLDGSLDLSRDWAAGGFLIENGVLRTNGQPGLGASPSAGA
jgi:L-alanine-DL-glutamate epimerase-like enolase superfamily enzyme